MQQVQELVLFAVQKLVTLPNDVAISVLEEDTSLVVRVVVAPKDLGRLIGTGGRILRALRTLVRSFIQNNRCEIVIDVAK